METDFEISPETSNFFGSEVKSVRGRDHGVTNVPEEEERFLEGSYPEGCGDKGRNAQGFFLT